MMVELQVDMAPRSLVVQRTRSLEEVVRGWVCVGTKGMSAFCRCITCCESRIDISMNLVAMTGGGGASL